MSKKRAFFVFFEAKNACFWAVFVDFSAGNVSEMA